MIRKGWRKRRAVRFIIWRPLLHITPRRLREEGLAIKQRICICKWSFYVGAKGLFGVPLHLYPSDLSSVI